jgi:hypothetical protein
LECSVKPPHSKHLQQQSPYQFRATPDPKLDEDIPHVEFHSLLGDQQSRSNFRIGEALNATHGNLRFSAA